MIRNLHLNKNSVQADVEKREQIATTNGLIASEAVESINNDMCEREKHLSERELWLNKCMENIKQFIRNIDVNKL